MVFVLQGDKRKKIYMDGYLREALDRAKYLLDRDWDALFIVDGPERSGKSVMAQQVAAYLDPTFDISRVYFTGKDFKDAIHNAKQHQAVVFDEGMSALFSRRTMSDGNIRLIQYLAEVGQKNLFLIIVLPSFFVLDMYAAVARSSALIHIYTGDGLERGYFMFFNRQHKQDLFAGGKKGFNYGAVSPDFRGRFLDGYVVDEVEYRKKKAETLNVHIDKDGMNREKRDKNIYEMHLKGISEKNIQKRLEKMGIRIQKSRVHDIIDEQRKAANE